MANSTMTPDQLEAAILAFTAARAIPRSDDPQENQKHEQVIWTAIEAAFADQYQGDLLDLLDDYAAAIQAAMYRGEDSTPAT